MSFMSVGFGWFHFEGIRYSVDPNGTQPDRFVLVREIDGPGARMAIVATGRWDSATASLVDAVETNDTWAGDRDGLFAAATEFMRLQHP